MDYKRVHILSIMNSHIELILILIYLKRSAK